MRLSEIQHRFKDTMLDPAHIDGAEGAAFRALFAQNTGICLENRLKVYRNNVIKSLTGAAMAALPMTQKLVGEEFLERAVRAYIIGNLPTEGNLNLYGLSFPAFIRDYEPAQALPYLHDFTRLEWAWEAAYYADDDTPLAPEALATLDQETLPDLTLQLRSSCALIESEWPLDAIVDFCRSDDSDEDMQALPERGVTMMVFRPALKVEMRRLHEAEYAFLQALRNGQTIYESAVTAEAIDPNIDLTEILQKHLSLGTFAGFAIRSNDNEDITG